MFAIIRNLPGHNAPPIPAADLAASAGISLNSLQVYISRIRQECGFTAIEGAPRLGYRLGECPDCEGRGRAFRMVPKKSGDGEKKEYYDCPTCDGSTFAEEGIPSNREKAKVEEELLGVILTDKNVEVVAKNTEALAGLVRGAGVSGVVSAAVSGSGARRTFGGARSATAASAADRTPVRSGLGSVGRRRRRKRNSAAKLPSMPPRRARGVASSAGADST